MSVFELSFFQKVRSTVTRIAGTSIASGYAGLRLARKRSDEGEAGIVVSYRCPSGQAGASVDRQWLTADYFLDGAKLRQPLLSAKPFFAEVEAGPHEFRAEGSYTSRNPTVRFDLAPYCILLIDVFPERSDGERARIEVRSDTDTIIASSVSLV